MSDIKIFENKKVRSHWDAERETWFFSVIDIIEILTGSTIPKRYWADLKKKLTKEGTIEEEEYKPLSVTQAGVEPEQIAEQIEGKEKREENSVDQVLRAVDDDSLSFDDLIRILRGQ